MKKKCLLIILDGWGIAEDKSRSAIDAARTPFLDSLYKNFPHSKLQASGPAVGLPEGQMGNSEVGHYTIGAGRVLKQSLVEIDDAIADGSFYQNEALLEAFAFAKKNDRAIHLLGLTSDGGVHSHMRHIMALCSMAKELDVKKLFLHAFTDGRDTGPTCAKNSLKLVEEHMRGTVGSIATIMGRYYAMDRDNRWDRTAAAHRALLHGVGERFSTWQEAIDSFYAKGVTDEFFLPIKITSEHTGDVGIIKPHDVVIAFNFRADRMRQLTHAITQSEVPAESLKPIPLYYVSFTNYDDSLSNVHVAFDNSPLGDTLGHVLSKNNLSQARIAETEKYAHVTYFLSGGAEGVVPRETRILCPSPPVSTYDLVPEMAAYDIKGKTVEVLASGLTDFVCVNFANADMVGHTGVFDAAVRACEAVDRCLEEIVPLATKTGYEVLITADHGNADVMIDENEAPHTAHTYNLVPCILVSENKICSLRDGSLADVAPTILRLMGLPKSDSMTGRALV